MTTINTIEDLIKALDENPQWVEALRVRLLTRELIELPEKFAQFVTATNQHFTRLEENFAQFVTATNEHFTRLEENFAQFVTATNEHFTRLEENLAQFVTATNEHFTRLEENLAQFVTATNEHFDKLETDVQEIRGDIQDIRGDVKTIRDDLGVLKGAHARNAAHTESVLVAAELGFSLVRTLGFDDLLRITREANTVGIPANQLRSFRRADLVMEVVDQAGESCYLAVEVSYTIDERDTSRAVRNAEFLTAFTDRRAYPVVAGLRYDDRVQTGIESGEMLWYEIGADSLEPE